LRVRCEPEFVTAVNQVALRVEGFRVRQGGGREARRSST
jgi:hypothetical protein